MDELEISGKRYISTRRAAREHGYHSDYMGQLIRGKKVAGQKVGRAWYIEEDSLNVYLGKAVASAPKPAAIEEAPAPIERLVAEEPAAAPQLADEDAAPEPAVVPESVHVVAEAPQVIEETFIQEAEPAEPVAVHVAVPQTERVHVQPVQEIHHAPIEERETRIPIHTQAPLVQEVGGLRYAADDSAPMPIVSRMPQAQAPMQQYANEAVHAPRAAGSFPYISLTVVGVIAILATAFASNFVSATIVSQEGKAATVQYAIHW